MQIRAITSRLTVATYFALVLIPVILLGHDGPWFGPGDISIRGRAPLPEKFSPGAYAAFDLWFADRVGFRYPLIYAGTNFHIGLLHRPIDRHIVFGREGWMLRRAWKFPLVVKIRPWFGPLLKRPGRAPPGRFRGFRRFTGL